MAETISGSITTGVVLAGTMVISSAQDGVITVGNQVEGQIVGGPQGEQGPQGDPGANGQGVPTGGTAGQILTKDSGTDYDTSWQDPTGAVDSVNGQTGVVVLDADDIDDTSTTHKFVTASDLTTLSNTSGTNTGDQDLSGYAQTSSLATVATTGDYDDLTNKPVIPVALDDLSGDSDDVAEGSTNLYMTSLERSKLSGIEAGAEVNTVDSVAGKTGAVTLGSADLTATGGTSTSFLRKDNTWATPTNTTYSEISQAEIDAGTASTARTISGRRSQYIVDKARNGVTLDADTSLAGNGYFLDEDDMASNSATKVPSQQSVKAYVDNKPGIPKTFNLGTHPFFSNVTNTTAETSLNIFTLPANTVQANYLVSIKLTGTVNNTSGSPVTYTYKIKFGTLTWGTYTFEIPTGSNVPFTASLEAICVDLFGSLRLGGGGAINVASGIAGTNDAIVRTIAGDISPIPFTTNLPITLTIQMSAANANASFAAYSSTISVLNPAPPA